MYAFSEHYVLPLSQCEWSKAMARYGTVCQEMIGGEQPTIVYFLGFCLETPARKCSLWGASLPRLKNGITISRSAWSCWTGC